MQIDARLKIRCQIEKIVQLLIQRVIHLGHAAEQGIGILQRHLRDPAALRFHVSLNPTQADRLQVNPIAPLFPQPLHRGMADVSEIRSAVHVRPECNRAVCFRTA